jgi:predicted AAA+ superfamily ATPase
LTNNSIVKNHGNLLEETFVIFRVSAGIRNAILGNFNPLANRTDVGGLWKNYFLIKRMKHQANRGVAANLYFWKPTTQQEIDFIDQSG